MDWLHDRRWKWKEDHEFSSCLLWCVDMYTWYYVRLEVERYRARWSFKIIIQFYAFSLSRLIVGCIWLPIYLSVTWIRILTAARCPIRQCDFVCLYNMRQLERVGSCLWVWSTTIAPCQPCPLDQKWSCDCATCEFCFFSRSRNGVSIKCQSKSGFFFLSRPVHFLPTEQPKWSTNFMSSCIQRTLTLATSATTSTIRTLLPATTTTTRITFTSSLRTITQHSLAFNFTSSRMSLAYTAERAQEIADNLVGVKAKLDETLQSKGASAQKVISLFLSFFAFFFGDESDHPGMILIRTLSHTFSCSGAVSHIAPIFAHLASEGCCSS